MSFNEIKELRQAGKLDEALQMANQALETDPENIWNKRAAVWVYYDYLKKYNHPESFEAFRENLAKIRDLQLPEDEKMVFDNCAWQVGSLVFRLQRTEHVDYGQINELFEIIRDFHFTKPSDAYSFLYKAFHKGYHDWLNYLSFADWWNFENLRPEDYRKEEFGGMQMMSVAEQAYIAYAKKLLEGVPLDSFGQQRLIDKEKIQSFLPKLDDIIRKHPDYQYPPYFKAKFLLALGSDENVLSAFLPFAKQKRNDFWVWELMAEIYPEDKDIQFACYCKALSLKPPDAFLVKIRQTFAGMLIERNMLVEAKTEILKVIAAREENHWKLPGQITHWADQEWYKTAVAKKDNQDLYSGYVKAAEELLFRDIPEETIVVEFVNKNKSILSFVRSNRISGFFNYDDFLANPEIGELLKVRFIGNGTNGYYKVATLKKADTDENEEFFRNFKGVLKIIQPTAFGLADEVFIDPGLVKIHMLTAGQTVKGKAMLSYNKKKEQWGWKAISLIPFPCTC